MRGKFSECIDLPSSSPVADRDEPAKRRQAHVYDNLLSCLDELFAECKSLEHVALVCKENLGTIISTLYLEHADLLHVVRCVATFSNATEIC